jgi:hypothetical protein
MAVLAEVCRPLMPAGPSRRRASFWHGETTPLPVSKRETLGFVQTGRGPHFCRARDIDVEQIGMRLTLSRWKELQ